MDKKFALVIGINNYKESPLSCCISDALAISEALQTPVSIFSVTTLLDSQATRVNFWSSLDELLSKQSDLNLLYFSGHGCVTDSGAYLVSYDGQVYEEGIDLERLRRVITTKSKAPIIVILDCCHSGSATAWPDHGRSVHSDDINGIWTNLGQSRVILAACRPDEYAYEDSTLGHGVFTAHLLDGLSGNAADEEGDITVPTLYDYVSARLQNDIRQIPVFRGDISGRITISRGHEPRLIKKPSSQIMKQIEMEGAQLLDDFSALRTASVDEWKRQGHQIARQRFEPIWRWFKRKLSDYPELGKRSTFKQLFGSAQGQLKYLGNIVEGTNFHEGQVIESLGQGAFGTVWRIRSASGAKDIALKVYHPNEIGVNEKLERFHRGYRAMKKPNHKYIVKVHHFSECPIGFFMDYIEGTHLRGAVFNLDEEQLTELLITCAETIKYAHSEGVRHRDIKPENILTKYDQNSNKWVPYLSDFDLAWFSTATTLTIDGRAFGAMHYASPEQMLRPKADAASQSR